MRGVNVKRFSELKAYEKTLILVVAVLALLFFVGGPGYHSARSFKAIWNLGHLLFFALMPLLIYSHSSIQKYRTPIQIVILLAVTMALGALVEILQNGINRSLDLEDIFRDIIGVLIAIFFFLPTRKAFSVAVLMAMKIVVIVLVVIQLIPIAINLTDEHNARKSFPVLADFQTVFQRGRFEGGAERNVEIVADQPGNRAMRVLLQTTKYSGVGLRYFSGTWDSYRSFQFRVFNPSTDRLNLTCRIHDKKHEQLEVQQYDDRFNRSYQISQGWNTITIDLEDIRLAPKNRDMDLNQISGVGIFSVQLEKPWTIFIDDLRLL
jgi:VanZ family protein